jgi:hypothetical protein
MHPSFRPALTRRVTVWVGAVALFALGACGSSVPTGTDAAAVSPTQTVPPSIGPSGCTPASPSVQLPQGLQIRGVTNTPGDAIWALFQTRTGVHAGRAVAVHWRVSGSHALQITLVGPGDQLVRVTGAHPEPLPGWVRPGDPWAATLTFPLAGCWRIYVQRGAQWGNLWLPVT